ncbi:DNA invertase Pin-like site-specific DNA recombinase [Pseudomonas citronellolis]|uniref:recombinase family protein n=2 Tax=Pseudomonas citronellolis TaxID=53408 RepID=UPI00209F82FA|nr:recombinase family protein [Pseudomonas citronellolis]MCP1644902.1 DNA invertase Pin-like site-specific DNA recombinase [Pseudomonas citronellolis]MCP1667847.1 DNA invertase Pin-like site-specific DNA recombinase [Pseudomonas citronellolis]MCP1699057.1 DNA invertase Pin-like site-specific DNA recombinase [Pseudomonas citronellolis]MCP1704954.1 DNA invertase Pin-like site-specific DNA recombinase [Pseudomonas citronellolis]MCP1799620.1 DNA invertase Pin-like site-specific DNA recombinase [Ps
MMNIGYARVSTEEQDLSLQIGALEAYGCERIFSDHGLSGGLRTRPGLGQALDHLSQGDKLVVWRLDRLGRSLAHLVDLLDCLGARKIGFSSLNENIDTSSSGGRLVFHIMAAMAEFERGLISERTRAGMAAARAQGRHVGRHPTLNTQQCAEAFCLIDHEGLALETVASRFNVHPRTLQRSITKFQLLPASLREEMENTFFLHRLLDSHVV